MKSSKLAVVLAVALAGCGGAVKNEDTGGMKVNVSSAALVADGTVTLEVNGPKNYTETGALPFSYVGTPCPIGHYTFTANSIGSGGATFHAEGAFDVAAGTVTQLNVMMEQTNAVPMVVIAPFTQSISIDNLPATGHAGWKVPLNLTAIVTHPDNDHPDMDWFISMWRHSCAGEEVGGSGFFFLPLDIDFYIDGFSKPTAKVKTSFTSFCQGVETITFEAVNTNSLLCPAKGCRLVSTVSFTIPYLDQGFAADIDFNFAPVVSCDYVNNAEPLPGEEVTVTATAFDPENDAMTYAWTATCGTIKEGTANQLNTVWIAPAGNCQACTLRLDVTDARGGVNYGTIGVKTAPADVTAGCPVVQ
jgi:hypothetical protein